MTNPTMLNSDDELAKIGARIVEASEELDDTLQAAAREIVHAQQFLGLFDLPL